VYLITGGGKRVFQRSHVTKMVHVYVLPTVLAEPLVTFVAVTRHEQSTRRTCLTFAYGLLPCAGVLLVVLETGVVSKMSVAFVAWDSDVGVRTRRARYTVARRRVTDVSDVTFTCFVARFTYVLAMAPVKFVIS